MSLDPIDIPRLEALLAARSESTESYNVYLMTLLCNAPALLAELKELREKVQMTVGYNTALRSERDRLRAERDAANAAVAGLREALDEAYEGAARQLAEPRNYDNDQYALTAIATTCELALSRTPDQHRARIEAGGKLAVAEWIENEVRSGDQYYERSREGMLLEAQELRAEADRLEKGEGNGIHR